MVAGQKRVTRNVERKTRDVEKKRDGLLINGRIDEWIDRRLDKQICNTIDLLFRQGGMENKGAVEVEGEGVERAGGKE